MKLVGCGFDPQQTKAPHRLPACVRLEELAHPILALLLLPTTPSRGQGSNVQTNFTSLGTAALNLIG